MLFVNDSVQLWTKTLEVFGDFEIGGQVIRTVKYANGILLLAKGETVLQCMIDKLIEIGRFYGMEVYMENTRAMTISGQPPTIQIVVD
jgi:hypothetical protein